MALRKNGEVFCLSKAEAGRLWIICSHQYDLKWAVGLLGRVDEGGHVRAPARNEDRDARLSHNGLRTSLTGRSRRPRCQ